MKTADFLSVYPRDLTREQIHQGAINPEIRASQLYSYSYGQLLFDALQDKREDLPDRIEQLRTYEEGIDVKVLETEALQEEGWQHLNEINFQILNQHMFKMWDPLVEGQWAGSGDHERHAAANFSMDGLALDALTYYVFRERYVEAHGAETYYQADPKDYVGRITGVMQEYDGTIAALQWAKKQPGITVVPAPAQFEHNAGRANADLLVIDLLNDKMTGLQIKTTASQRTRGRYDEDRIVVIDSNDLANVRVLPAKKGKRVTPPKPWPGIIAASRVDAINTRNNPHISPLFYDYLRRRKMEAKIQLGNMRVDYNEVSKDIGQKILEKL